MAVTEQPGAFGPQEIDPRKLVFVGGLHRSGTTPLTRILGAHPSVSTFRDTGVKEDEGQHLQSVYPSARVHGGYGAFAFSAAAHLTEESGLCSPENAGRLLQQWTPYWDTTRPLLVEKSPPNIVMTRFLTALFPGCRIVVCVRHPVVVALSTNKWTGPMNQVVRLVDHWLTAHDIFVQDAQHLSNVHVLRYEHLVLHPIPTLERLRAFLGLQSQIPSGAIDPHRSDSYLAEWNRLRCSRWPWRHGIAQAVESRRGAIARFGYDLDDLTTASDLPLIPRGRTGD